MAPSGWRRWRAGGSRRASRRRRRRRFAGRGTARMRSSAQVIEAAERDQADRGRDAIEWAGGRDVLRRTLYGSDAPEGCVAHPASVTPLVRPAAARADDAGAD